MRANTKSVVKGDDEVIKVGDLFLISTGLGIEMNINRVKYQQGQALKCEKILYNLSIKN